MILLKECPICDKEDWHSLDYLRNFDLWYYRDYREEGEQIGWKICKNCGYSSYDQLGEARQRESYTRQRGVVQANSLITGERKNKYHAAFFADEIKPEMKILDVGCAQGSFLNWIHENYNVPNENLYGNEFAEDLISWGKYHFGLNVDKEINRSIKYDLVSYYHVFEHVENITTEINMIKEIMADDGLFYCSVPLFFDELEEKSGMPCLEFEEYYHLNHIQCFSKNSFQNFLRKHGFEIIKEDEVLYAYTVLCKKTEPKEYIEKDNFQYIINVIEHQKAAIELLNQGKHEDAIKEYAEYPDAYVLLALNNENMKDGKKQIEILNRGLEVLPDNPKLLNQLGKCLMQWDENTAGKHFYSNNVKKAETIFNQLLKIKPGMEDSHYFLAMIEGKYKKNYETANEHLRKFIAANVFKFGETIPLISNFWKELYNANKN